MNMKPTITIQFPNLLLIPLFSVIGTVLKFVFGIAEYSWISVILTLPIVFYFVWSIGYCLLIVFALLICKLYELFTR